MKKFFLLFFFSTIFLINASFVVAGPTWVFGHKATTPKTTPTPAKKQTVKLVEESKEEENEEIETIVDNEIEEILPTPEITTKKEKTSNAYLYSNIIRFSNSSNRQNKSNNTTKNSTSTKKNTQATNENQNNVTTQVEKPIQNKNTQTTQVEKPIQNKNTQTLQVNNTTNKNTENKTILNRDVIVFTYIFDGKEYEISLDSNDKITLPNCLQQEIGAGTQEEATLRSIFNGYIIYLNRTGKNVSLESFIASSHYSPDYSSSSTSRYNLNGVGYYENVVKAVNDFINSKPDTTTNSNDIAQKIIDNNGLYAGYGDLLYDDERPSRFGKYNYYMESIASYKENHPDKVLILSDPNSPYYNNPTSHWVQNVYAYEECYPDKCLHCNAYIAENGFCYNCTRETGKTTYNCTCGTILQNTTNCTNCHKVIKDTQSHDMCTKCKEHYLIEGICYYCFNKENF